VHPDAVNRMIDLIGSEKVFQSASARVENSDRHLDKCKHRALAQRERKVWGSPVHIDDPEFHFIGRDDYGKRMRSIDSDMLEQNLVFFRRACEEKIVRLSFSAMRRMHELGVMLPEFSYTEGPLEGPGGMACK